MRNVISKTNEFLLKKYDLIVWRDRANYGTCPNSATVKTDNTKVVKGLTLLDINGYGSGQLHFQAEDSSYVVYPWCAIITMEPSPVAESKQ